MAGTPFTITSSERTTPKGTKTNKSSFEGVIPKTILLGILWYFFAGVLAFSNQLVVLIMIFAGIWVLTR